MGFDRWYESQQAEIDEQYAKRHGHLGLEWTNSFPTSPGFYWIRFTDGETNVIEIDKDFDPIYYRKDLEWYGPIQPPE